MNILFITKYPPIEGGTATRAYWLIQGLARLGHKIFVVTNACDVESDYRIDIRTNERKYLAGKRIVLINVDSSKVPHYIPRVRPDIALLANAAIQLTLKNKIDIICSWYLLPYGVAGMLVSKLTGIPHIVKHAGSDLGRLLQCFPLRNILFEVIKQADLIITTAERKKGFLLSGIKPEKIHTDANHTCAFREYFNRHPKKFKISALNEIPSNAPVIAYFGKIAKSKGLFELIASLAKIKDIPFYLLIVSSTKHEEFESVIRKSPIRKKIRIIPFCPPWQMPFLIRRARCVVNPERDFPVKRHVSVLINEVMASERCIILSNEVYENNKKISNLKDGKNVISVDVKNIKSFSDTLRLVLTNREFVAKIARNAYRTERKSVKSEAYLANFCRACEKLLKKQS